MARTLKGVRMIDLLVGGEFFLLYRFAQ